MGPFVRRLVALTVIWLLATAALTYAAARRIATPPPAATGTPAATTTSAAPTLTVPDVRRQAFVFAKGTLGDAGFGWKVEGTVEGYASNTVASQTPAPGTEVVDTGNPEIILHLERPAGAKELGDPEAASALAGTKIELAGASLAAAKKVAVPAPVRTKVVVPKKKPAPAKKRWPLHRPPAFVVAGARREPLDEMPLPDRASMLLNWLQRNPKPTDANVRYWLFQHAWVVAGARMGWWHGQAALETLLAADKKVWDLWGVGARSEALARQALAEVEARSR